LPSRLKNTPIVQPDRQSAHVADSAGISPLPSSEHGLLLLRGAGLRKEHHSVCPDVAGIIELIRSGGAGQHDREIFGNHADH
jgi:hypothetical protein